MTFKKNAMLGIAVRARTPVPTFSKVRLISLFFYHAGGEDYAVSAVL
jgi:hypothetical protein